MWYVFDEHRNLILMEESLPDPELKLGNGTSRRPLVLSNYEDFPEEGTLHYNLISEYGTDQYEASMSDIIAYSGEITTQNWQGGIQIEVWVTCEGYKDSNVATYP